MIRLLWAIHDHQPVGNFEFIFERAFERAYRPFIDVLERHPRVRISLHFSGILLDWLEANRPEYIARLQGMVRAGQIEILGGAHYEPILAMLSDADREGQVRKLSESIRRLFGEAPRGMWLAERVWEPGLVAPLARAGIEYVLLDGSHFKMVGKTEADMDGFFWTEDQGERLALFPIHDTVRDWIPFRPVEEVMDGLRRLDASGGVQIVFGDDGEKFGDWPFTYETVYEHGWLERFFTAVEAEPKTFSVEPLRSGFVPERSLGLIYLPPASYQEMMVWAQAPGEIPRFRALREELESSGRGEDAKQFLKGTFWRNFLAKYPESNRMHKQGQRLSRAVATALAERNTASLESARDHVWQSQCNCGYWHGVFGGLYLPHLRFANYRHLIAAQKLLDEESGLGASDAQGPGNAEVLRDDWDCDGSPDISINTPSGFFAFTAAGELDQCWLKRTGVNLVDTLTRRPEAYHALLKGGGEGGTKLENQLRAKEEGLADQVVYDKRLRRGFQEWILPPATAFRDYQAQVFEPAAVCRYSESTAAVACADPQLLFRGEAEFPGGGMVALRKEFVLAGDGSGLRARWEFVCEGAAVKFRFAAETLYALLAPRADDRKVRWNGSKGPEEAFLAERGDHPGLRQASVWDGWLRLTVNLEAPGAAGIWRDALETVSQSEGGYEKVYQGTVLTPYWDLDIKPGATAVCEIALTWTEEAEPW